ASGGPALAWCPCSGWTAWTCASPGSTPMSQPRRPWPGLQILGNFDPEGRVRLHDVYPLVVPLKEPPQPGLDAGVREARSLFDVLAIEVLDAVDGYLVVNPGVLSQLACGGLPVLGDEDQGAVPGP